MGYWIMSKKMRIHYEINYPKKENFLYLLASPSIAEKWNFVREKKTQKGKEPLS